MITFIRKKLRYIYNRIVNIFHSEEDISDAKDKWNRLAKEDASYYIFTDKEISSSKHLFRGAGLRDVDTYFAQDTFIKEYLSKKKEIHAVEIGCGIGRLSEHVAPYVQSLIGTDISEEMIAQARKRLSAIQNIRFESTDGLHVPVSDDSIDIVFSFIVFQHMSSVAVVKNNIEEIARILCKGGIAKIQLRGVIVSKQRWYYGPAFTVSDVKRLISSTPLSLIHTENEGQKYFWVWLKRV